MKTVKTKKTEITNNNNSKNILELNLIENIKKISLETIDLKYEIEKINNLKKEIEIETMIEIINEKDEKDKPVYSNSEKREAELKNRLNNNKKYNNLLNKLQNEKINLEKKYIEIEYNKNLLKFYLKENKEDAIY